MKIVKVSAIPMSAPVPEEKRHRTDLGTKVKCDATLIRVEADNGLTGIGAAPPSCVAVEESGRRLARAVLEIMRPPPGLSPRHGRHPNFLERQRCDRPRRTGSKCATSQYC